MDLDRREFAALLPALLACFALAPEEAQAQHTLPTEEAQAQHTLPTIVSGVYKPTPPKAGSQAGHVSSHYLAGMLTAGNIRLEMHESTIQPGAQHEAVGTHKHSEIWLVREGTAALWLNGVTRKLGPGDVGICIAGDKHYVANGGDTPVTYFVVTVGPPE